MFYAKEDISANDVINFFDGDATPLKTQEAFLNAFGIIENATRSYQKGEKITPSQEQPDLISAEAENIRKLNAVMLKSSVAGQKIITSLIIKKLSALKVLSAV